MATTPIQPQTPPGMVDPAQESLVRALHASFYVLRLLMLVLVALYLLSGIFRVEQGQVGLVARLGKLLMTSGEEGLTPVHQPGWHPALPDPFDTKYTITNKVLELKTTHFMFRHDQAATSKNLAEIVPPLNELQPGVQGAMLTGDRNLSHGRWEVQYEIKDAAVFLQTIGKAPAEFEPLLQRLTESAVVREVSGRTVEEVTRTGIDAVRGGVKRRLQEALRRLNTGVEVTEVVAYTIEPGSVRMAFLDVFKAQSERETDQQKAREKATEILNSAAGDRPTYEKLLQLITAYGAAQLRGAAEAELAPMLAEIDAQLVEAARLGAGQVTVKLTEARAAANETKERAQREYEQFRKYYDLRAVRPRIALLGLWVEMRQDILANRLNEIFFVPASNEIEILINRDPQRRIELEEKRALERRSGAIEGSQSR